MDQPKNHPKKEETAYGGVITGGNAILGCRQSASTVLREKARSMRRMADRLEALANAAEGMDLNAEEALWHMAITKS